MASIHCLSPHFLFVFLVSATAALAESNGGGISHSDFEFPKTQAQKLIRSLNLFPKHEVNHRAVQDDDDFGASRIVEKPLRLPFLADSGPSLQELGHHAGYYKLPHTKDARYIILCFCY